MGQFITPPTIPDDTYCRTLKIPNSPQWIGAVSGALMPLIYSSEWVSVGGITPEEAANRAEIMFNEYLISGDNGVCGDMACCEDIPKRFRIDPVTKVVQQSNNGGATWQASGGGMQQYIVEPIPPVTSGVSGTKCDAASNLKEQVQVWINQVSNDFTTAGSLVEFGLGVIVAIAGAVLVVLTDGAFAPIEVAILTALGAALTAAWGAGKVAFDNYWTTANKDKVFCAAVCNIGDDGSFTLEQFTAFWNKVNDDLPPNPAKMLFMGFLSSVGKEGLNAMAASGTSADSDCTDCTCDNSLHIYYSDLVNPLVELFPDGSGVYTAVQSGTPTGDGFYWTVISASNPINSTTYSPCFRMTDLTGGATFQEFYRCHDGVVDPLSTCNAFYTNRWTETGHTITFKVDFGAGDACS